MARILTLALVAFFVAPVLAEDKKVGKEDKDTKAKCEGFLADVTGQKIMVTEKGAKEDKGFTVAKDAKITCDGKECKLEDLKKGVFVCIWTDKDDGKSVTKIEADTKKKGTTTSTDKATTKDK